MEAGQLTVRLDPRRFTLETVLDAYAAIADRTTAGKLVVDLPPSTPATLEGS